MSVYDEIKAQVLKSVTAIVKEQINQAIKTHTGSAPTGSSGKVDPGSILDDLLKPAPKPTEAPATHTSPSASHTAPSASPTAPPAPPVPSPPPASPKSTEGGASWGPDSTTTTTSTAPTKVEAPRRPGMTPEGEVDPVELIAMLIGYLISMIQRYGGIRGFIDEMRKRGLADHVASWVGTGPNRALALHEVETVLSPRTIDALADQFGVSRVTMTHSLSTVLPEVIDRFTPAGNVPDNDPWTH